MSNEEGAGAGGSGKAGKPLSFIIGAIDVTLHADVEGDVHATPPAGNRQSGLPARTHVRYESQGRDDWRAVRRGASGIERVARRTARDGYTTRLCRKFLLDYYTSS